ncbi:transcription factor bHLH94-like [Lolium perenne]|uniref:transcription factor bHLH94-like n=1 Tax=Lolium perenne TaxID=4522 RepID=UPI0021F5FDAB|nr:transcription factor bHLH94-like [Lolium perenne]
MALEAVVFSGGFCGYGTGIELEGSNACWAASLMIPGAEVPRGSSSLAALPPPVRGGGDRGGAEGAEGEAVVAAATSGAAGRRKRRRARSVKNVEEAETQRMTHIAVERNRRKQMNEYLAVLRSTMPPSYVQRGDQASIIGGAINYVKELEQLVQSLEARCHARLRNPVLDDVSAAVAVPFADFFTFPQYTMSVLRPHVPDPAVAAASAGETATDADEMATGSKHSAVADIEVTIVESHANLKLLSRRRPRQLLRIVAGLQGHRLAVLHLNATSAGHMALYSLSLKVEDDCRLSSVDDIAAAVHRIVEMIAREEEHKEASRS